MDRLQKFPNRLWGMTCYIELTKEEFTEVDNVVDELIALKWPAEKRINPTKTDTYYYIVIHEGCLR